MTVQPPQSAEPGTTRRTVIRTVGHAAWVAPVIIAATTAPAFGVSGFAELTTVVSGVAGSGVNPPLAVTTTLTNNDTGAAGPITLTISATPDPLAGTIAGDAPTLTTPDGWGFVTQGGSPSARTYTFLRPAGLVGSGTTTLVFTVPLTLSLGAISTGTLNAAPSIPGPGTASSGSGTW